MSTQSDCGQKAYGVQYAREGAPRVTVTHTAYPNLPAAATFPSFHMKHDCGALLEYRVSGQIRVNEIGPAWLTAEIDKQRGILWCPQCNESIRTFGNSKT